MPFQQFTLGLKRKFWVCLVMAWMMTGCPGEPGVSKKRVRTSSLSAELAIFYTNDLHSRFRGTGPTKMFTPKVEDGDPVRGHYARLASVLKKRRAESEAAGIPSLALDAGDFYSGSIFSTLGPNPDVDAVPELEFFHDLNYDAITLGNHEFDAGLNGLDVMLRKAVSKGIDVPILSNVRMEQEKESAREFVHRFMTGDAPTIQSSIIRHLSSEEGDLRVGILGAMGVDSINASLLQRGGLSFHGYDDDENENEEMKFLVAYLQEEVEKLHGQVDFLVLVFHGLGTSSDQESFGEVMAIAEAIPEIDLIVAGHLHGAFHQPMKIGQTYIVQAGDHGKFLGEIRFSIQAGEVLQVENQLHEINDGVESDPQVMASIEHWVQLLKSRSENDFDQIVLELEEPIQPRTHALSSYLAEKLFQGTHEAAQASTLPEPAAYFMLNGYVREGFPVSGQYSYADVSRVFDSGVDDRFMEGSSVVVACTRMGFFHALWMGGVRLANSEGEYSDWNFQLAGREEASLPFSKIPIAINQALFDTFQYRLPSWLQFTDCKTGEVIDPLVPEAIEAIRLKDPGSGLPLKEQDLFVRGF